MQLQRIMSIQGAQLHFPDLKSAVSITYYFTCDSYLELNLSEVVPQIVEM